MKIKLKCRCGSEGEWDHHYSAYVKEEADKWTERHMDCLRQVEGSSIQASPSPPIKKIEKWKEPYVY